MKTRYILTCIAALLAFCACNNTKEEVEINGTQLVLTACQEGSAGSKTAVEDGGKQVFWEPGDEIKVFSGSRSGKFTSAAKSLEAVTTFTGHLEGTGPDVEDIWAVYPYSDDASFDGKCITTVIPSVQVARPGTFAPGANVAIAHSTTTSLQFYNVGGGIRFSLTEEGVKKVIFEGLGGEVISGTVKVGFEEGLPKVKEISDGSMFITLTPPDGESFATGKWYYLIVIPGTLECGFKFRLYKNDETCARIISEKSTTIKRKTFGAIDRIDNGLTYSEIVRTLPETAEELKASLELTTSISQMMNAIDENLSESDKYNVEVLANEYGNIEGVAFTSITEDGNIAVVQDDGLVLNVLMNGNDYINTFGPWDERTVPTMKSANSRANRSATRMVDSKHYYSDDPILVNKGHKALILAPFEWQFKSNVYKIADCISPFFDLPPVVLANDSADITKFKGDYLSQYDFIFIYAHGGIGYKAVNREKYDLEAKPKNFLENVDGCFIMATATECLPEDVGTYIELGMLSWDELALVKLHLEDETYRLCMIPSMLDGASMNNAFVVLNSCCSAADEIWSGEGSLKDAFFRAGAAYYSGYQTDVSSVRANFILEHALSFMAHGISYEDAFSYWANSDLLYHLGYCEMNWLIDQDEAWHMENAKMTRDESLKDSEISLFAPWRFESNPSIGDMPGYFFNPFPHLFTPSVSDNQVNLKWSSDLSSFNEKAQYTNYEGRQWTVNEERDYPQTLTFRIYIDGKPIKECSGEERTTSIDVDEVKTHNCIVVAELQLNEGQVISYESNIESFEITASEEYPSPEAVDLGLPSGLKWATMNVGATKPEEYGEYFAWGEAQPKSYYDWSTFTWCNGDFNKLTKYCNLANSHYWDGSGSPDNKVFLNPEDDAAYVNWGGSWRMPTDEEWAELQNNCTWTWTADYNGTGIAGYIVTSNKAGYEGASIFLPAAGVRFQTDFYYGGSNGYYWSSVFSTESPSGGWNINFDSSNIRKEVYDRCTGFSVRPVEGSVVPVSGIKVQASLNMFVGETATLQATVSPSNATYRSISWVSSDNSVARVYYNGKVVALSAGTVTITVYTADSSCSATCEVTVMETATNPNGRDYVDLGLPSGLKWATMNVGATKPEEYGEYYAWGETEPKSDYSWSTYKFELGTGYKGPFSKYVTISSYGTVDNKTVLDPEDDAARANWGGSWRMPTYAEWIELIDKCTWTWTTQNGVNGRLVTSKTNSNSIFLPAAGFRYDTSIGDAGSEGSYWSSSLSTGRQFDAWGLDFDSPSVGGFGDGRLNGRSIRPVCPKD